MEAIFKNDIAEGNRTIVQLSKTLQVPYRLRILSQIIFQQTYPRFFKRESHNTIALLSIYLASKMNETLLKLDVLLEGMTKLGSFKAPPRDRMVRLECKMVEICNFEFDVEPAQLFLLRLGKALGIDVADRLAVLDDLHSDNRVNSINYFSGIYDPKVVALSMLRDEEIGLFECFFSVRIERSIVEEIRAVLLKNLRDNA
jgi:hypothetical protein